MIINKAIYEQLQAVARAGQTILYGQLAATAGLDIHSQADRRKLGRYLDAICHFEYANGRPLLSVVVIRERLPAPGKTFFTKARQLGVVNGQTDEEFFATELQRVHAFWKNAPVQNEEGSHH